MSKPSKKTAPARKLSLSKTTLRELRPAELDKVAGGPWDFLVLKWSGYFC